MNDVTKHYGPVFKGWQSKQLGSKPTAEQLTVAHAFGRPGKQSLALAMAMRAEGVTAAQIQIAAGAPQNNHRRGLLSEGLFKREAVAANDLGHTVYKIALTAKGTAAMAKREAALAKATAEGTAPKAKAVKASKGKGASKPRARKVTTPTPVTEAPEAPAPVAEAPTGDQPQA